MSVVNIDSGRYIRWLQDMFRLLWPRSLLSRMLCMLVIALLLAESISGSIWYRQFSLRNQASLESTIKGLVQGMLTSYNFMSSLPYNYRHLVLQQQLALGGSQFFISINNHVLDEVQLLSSQAAKTVVSQAKQELRTQLGERQAAIISLTPADQLKVFNAGVLVENLPPAWARFGITTSHKDAPVLVIQLQLNTNEWLFLAAPLPPPYDQLESPLFSLRQVGFTLCSLLLVLLFTWWLIRRELKPLARLAHGALELNSSLDSEPLPEEGSAELVTATRSFNQMQSRLRAYLHNREMLFTAISHDLKTPLTRLRLRVEMLEDDKLGKKFEQDVADLEMMVKGALQSMKDTDLHENLESIDIMNLLRKTMDAYLNVNVSGKASPIFGRPLAIKRLLNNIVDNGLNYGRRVEIVLSDHRDYIMLFIRDFGPGIPEDQWEKVFKPYYRLQQDNRGSGLGLAISRSIARAHGGEVTLHNHPSSGLIVEVRLQRYN
ncbi:osmolarity sensor protein [Yersinia kristensenii]|nr:osmolarity sensor protein [Yersinia kristensenii]